MTLIVITEWFLIARLALFLTSGIYQAANGVPTERPFKLQMSTSALYLFDVTAGLGLPH